jgi:hypothetical protein
MKKLLLLTIVCALYFSSTAQKTKDAELTKRISLIENRIAIKNLVDTFSILADTKDTKTQALLFTENATVESRVNGQPGMVLSGRDQIGGAFGAFLQNFETVYHLNGQQTVDIKGDKASGTSYCLVTLIGAENGKKMKTTMGVYYHDEFVKEKNRWLISKRTSNFVWQEKQELKQ